MGDNKSQGGNPEDTSDVSLDDVMQGEESFKDENFEGDDPKRDDPSKENPKEKEETEEQKAKREAVEQEGVPFDEEEESDEDKEFSINGETEEVLNKLYGSVEGNDFRAETIKNFGGSDINEDGDIVNEDDEIVMSRESIAKYIQTGELPIDEEGNATDELGNILRTKEELDRDNSLVYSTRLQLEEELGVELIDEEGNPLEFEDNDEGILKLVKESVKRAKGQPVKDFLESNPQIKSYYQHLALGKDPKEYNFGVIDYKSVDVDSLSKEQKLGYIAEAFKKRGFKNPSDYVSLIEEKGEDKIQEEASKALLDLNELQSEEQKNLQKEYEREEQKRQEENQQYWNEVKGIVNKGSLGDITIPEKERKDFFEFLSKPVDKQMRSKDMILEEQQPEEARLMMSYLRYKGKTISDLAKIMAKEERVKSIRDKANKERNKVTSAQTRNTSKGKRAFMPSLEKMNV